MSNICDNVISAIDILTNQKIAKAGYDRTIEAQIISCVDLANKKYKLRYQNSTIYALASESYSKGDLVLVTIPQNNNNAVKRIIGLSESKTIKSNTLSDIYESIGANGVLNESEFNIPAKESHYSIEILNGENDLDQDIIKQSIKSSNSLVINAAFKTNLTEEQIASKGDYGLEFNLIFLDAETKQEIPQQYVLDINYIEGFPYELYNYAYTTATFDNIDGMNFDRIESINFYSKNFKPSSDDTEKNIFVKDISIIGAKKIEAINQTGIMVSILTKDGYYFTNPKEEAKPLSLTAQVRDDGKVIEIDPTNIKIYWFRENPLVDSRHDYYNRYGGNGWTCLNEREPLYDDEGNIKTDENGNIQYSRNWIPAGAEYIVNPSEIQSKNANFKCVVVSGVEQDDSEVITLYHTDSSITTYSITSTIEENIAKLECLPYNTTFKYTWVVIKDNGTIIQLTEGNKLEVNLASIGGSAEYCCVVTQDLGGYPIANPKITLQENKVNNPFYRVVIKNGERMFLYNEDGSAKAYDIPALEAILYNPDGKVITQDQYTVTWEYPSESLINIKTFFNEDEEINSNYFYYTIASRYKQSLKNANQIKAIINYGDIQVEGYTDIMFAREGELGTNGTGAYCIIKPNISEDKVIDFYPTYTWVEDGLSGSWNFETDNTQPFKVELWTGMDNQELISTPSWSVLKSTLSNIVSSFTENGSVINQTYPNNEDIYVNLLKAEIEINNQIHSSVIAPICAKVKQDYSISLKYGTGFQNILFSSDGRNAKFIDRPFEVVIITSKENPSLTYEWIIHQDDTNKILGFKEDKNTINPVSLDIKYNALYKGNYTATALECIVKDNNEECARIYIPIHMYLNTYGNAALNGWDGNSLQLNEDDAYLLAPQIGAGKKNSDNSFTGVVMGEVQESNNISKIGLLGYNKGAQTIFLDANTGAATFGALQDNQIILDPESGKVIIHGDIYANDGKFTGTIEARSGSFKNGTFGDLEITGNLKYKNSNSYYIGTGSANSNYINIPNFRVGPDSAKISGFNFNETALYTDGKSFIDSNVSSNGIYLGTKGFALGGMVDTDYKLQEGNYITTSPVNEFKISKEGSKWNMIMANGSIKLFCPAIIPEDGPGSKNKFISLDGQNGDIVISNNYNVEFAQGQQMILNIDGIQYKTQDKDAFIQFLSEEEESSAYLIKMSNSYIDQIYSASSTIITSDETKKNTITPLSNQYSLLFDNLQPVTFKYNDGTSDRLHIGFGARATEQAVLDAGLTTQDFAAVCYNIDENGNKVDYGIRYEEIVALNTYEIQKLKARIVELENIIQELR